MSDREKIEEFLNNHAKEESLKDILARISATLKDSTHLIELNKNPEFRRLFALHCENRHPGLVAILSDLKTISPQAEKILSHSFRTSPRNQ